ncbi:MAG: hypothetical protein PVF33_01205 [Candidatus Latescibacterota bacterium]|jgi:hypothetical protein
MDFKRFQVPGSEPSWYSRKMDSHRTIRAWWAVFCLAAVWTGGSVPPSAAPADVLTPLEVRIDRHANVYVDGSRVDTLVVCRRQPLHWRKLDRSVPDLSIRFERKLLHPRHPVTIRVSDSGKPASCRINLRARLRTYTGRPLGEPASGSAGPKLIYVRVVPPGNE